MLAFPAVLDKLHVSAFDLGQLVAPVLAAEPGLPADLRRQLASLEERILEVSALYYMMILYEDFPWQTEEVEALPALPTDLRRHLSAWGTVPSR